MAGTPRAPRRPSKFAPRPSSGGCRAIPVVIVGPVGAVAVGDMTSPRCPVAAPTRSVPVGIARSLWRHPPPPRSLSMAVGCGWIASNPPGRPSPIPRRQENTGAPWVCGPDSASARNLGVQGTVAGSADARSREPSSLYFSSLCLCGSVGGVVAGGWMCAVLLTGTGGHEHEGQAGALGTEPDARDGFSRSLSL